MNKSLFLAGLRGAGTDTDDAGTGAGAGAAARGLSAHAGLLSAVSRTPDPGAAAGLEVVSAALAGGRTNPGRLGLCRAAGAPLASGFLLPANESVGFLGNGFLGGLGERVLAAGIAAARLLSGK